MPGAKGAPEVTIPTQALNNYLNGSISAEKALAETQSRLTRASDNAAEELHDTLSHLSADKTLNSLDALSREQEAFDHSLEQLKQDPKWDTHRNEMEFQLLAATHTGFKALQSVIGSNPALQKAMDYMKPLMTKRQRYEEALTAATGSAGNNQGQPTVQALFAQVQKNHTPPEPVLMPTQATKLEALVTQAYKDVEATKQGWLKQLPNQLETAATQIGSQVRALQKTNSAYREVDIPTIDAEALAKEKLTPQQAREALDWMKQTVASDAEAVQQNHRRILTEQGSVPALVYKASGKNQHDPVSNPDVLITFARYQVPTTKGLNPGEKAQLFLANLLFPPPALRPHEEGLVRFVKTLWHWPCSGFNWSKAIDSYRTVRDAEPPKWVTDRTTRLYETMLAHIYAENVRYAQGLEALNNNIVELLETAVAAKNGNTTQRIKIANA